MQRGLEQGRAQALTGIEQKIAESNTIVLKHIARITQQVDAACRTLEDDARALALTVGRKMGSRLLAEARHSEIEALVTEALSLLPGQPHVVIRVNEDLLDGFRLRFEAIAEESGYQGKLILLGEPDIEMADCQIEWADGGMRRDMAQLDSEIDRIVRRHLGHETQSAPPVDAQPGDVTQDATPTGERT
jgi:flagellar assembly protein FliH